MRHDVRDQIVDYVKHYSRRTGISIVQLVLWLGITVSKFHHWQTRYGRANGHNARMPRDGWLASWEQQAIIEFHAQYPLEG